MSNLSSLQKELANRSNPPASSQPNAIASTLASSLNAKNAPQYQQNMFANNVFMEMQRRMYASALNQQQQNQQNQQNGRNEEENNSMVKDAVMKDFVRFVQTLNEKFMTAVQKVCNPFFKLVSRGVPCISNEMFRCHQTLVLPKPKKLSSSN